MAASIDGSAALDSGGARPLKRDQTQQTAIAGSVDSRWSGRSVLPEAGPSNPVKAFSAYVNGINRELKSLVLSFEERRATDGETKALMQQELDSIVNGVLGKIPQYDGAQDVARVTLEKVLESTVVNLPSLIAGVWEDDAAHFLMYHDVLDVMVNCVNTQLVDGSLAMNTIEILLEAQTVQNAERLFVYLETRMDKLTEGMQAGRGKALVILRTLNDLLRRLSKSTHTVFCGRILLFLANIFPLGERSGVNLRGEFNKENVTHFEPEDARPELEASTEEDAELGKDEDGDDDTKMIEDQLLPTKATAGKGKDVKPAAQTEAPEDGEELEGMEMDNQAKAAAAADTALASPTKAMDRKRSATEPEFYTLFWSMQRYFSDPHTLFSFDVHPNLPAILSTFVGTFPTVPALSKDGTVSNKPTAAATPNLTLLREGVAKMLQVFSEASKKEKALQGAAKDKNASGKGQQSSRGEQSGKKSRSAEEDARNMFFYPKFLTSKALLDLEIADATFRKQVMVQCLILFQYINSFTDAAKAKQAAALAANQKKSNLLPYKLSDADYKWVRELEARVYTEISRTPTDGETFVKTVRVVLQGERNWTRWKANSCPLFEKPALSQDVSDAAKAQNAKLSAPAPGFPHRAGTAALTRLWLNQPKTLQGFVKKDRAADLDTMFESAKRQNELIHFRKEELKDDGKTEPADLQADSELQQLQERKASLAWRILRLVSLTQAHLFSKIGVMDVEKLLEEMNKPAQPVATEHAGTPMSSAAGDDAPKVKLEGQASQNGTPLHVQDTSADTAVVADAPSPSAHKRPRADSGAEAMQEDPKKQKTDE